MRLIKFSLLALACLAATEIICPASAIAGDRPVALPDSGSSSISDTFSPEPRNAARVTARISQELAETLQMLQSRQAVDSVNGRLLSLSSEEVAAISAALSTGTDLEILEQQLQMEMGGLNLKISALDISPNNLAAAMKATNELVLSLNSEQLAAATESHIFIALLRFLEAANQAADEKELDAILAESSSMILLQMSRP